MKTNQIGILSLMAGVVVLSLSANQAKAETSIWGSDSNLGPYTKYYDDNGNLTRIVQTVYDGQSNPTIVYSFGGYYDGNTYMTEQVYSQSANGRSGMQDSSYGYLVGSNSIPISGKIIDNGVLSCYSTSCYYNGPSIGSLSTTTGGSITDIKLKTPDGRYVNVYGNPWVDNDNNNNDNNDNRYHTTYLNNGVEYSFDFMGSNSEITSPLKIYDDNGELLAEISLDGKEVGSNGVVLDSGTVTIYDHTSTYGSNGGHGSTMEAYDLTTGKLIKKVERNNSGTLDEYTYEYADNGAYSEYLNGSLLNSYNPNPSRTPKRIYTVQEAVEASSKGGKNTFTIRYR